MWRISERQTKLKMQRKLLIWKSFCISSISFILQPQYISICHHHDERWRRERRQGWSLWYQQSDLLALFICCLISWWNIVFSCCEICVCVWEWKTPGCMGKRGRGRRRGRPKHKKLNNCEMDSGVVDWVWKGNEIGCFKNLKTFFCKKICF